MATYFHVNSEIQAGDGGMQTLYFMNPNYLPYSDTASTSLPNNTLLLNPVNLSHAPPLPPSTDQHQHPLVGIPLPPPPSQDNNNINRTSTFHYDLWNSIDTHMASLAAASAANNNYFPMGLTRPLASVPNRQQGLSLSLSSQQVAAYSRPISFESDHHHHNHHHTEVRRGQVTVASTGELMKVTDSSPSSVSVLSNGISGTQSGIIMGSKYLRAVQELLDEVVKVENITDSIENGDKVKMKLKGEPKMAATVDHEDQPDGSTGESSKKSPLELTSAQRQELQTKKAKLANMLDEVEQRYKQYHQQMQLVVSAFEQAAGFGSAKSYTSVALRTISKQFRCLKDAISGQLKATSKKLGEDDCLGAKAESSRLKFVEQLQQQQRRFQQMGMVQHPAWRPQRGLPEQAVIVLRAWLFEHFLHPYPKDSDKQQLAKQTGLTRSQVSNWFINARVRLWKPMVEEMYLEEVKEQERNGHYENTSKTETQESAPLCEQIKALEAKAKKSKTQIASSSSPTTEHSNSKLSTSPMAGTLQQQTGFHLIGPSNNFEGFIQRRQKKPRTNAEMLNSPSSNLSMDIGMNQGETLSREIGRERLTINDPGRGFGTYSMGADFRRLNNPDHHLHHQLATPTFHGNNGVSLTLGLPHSENLSLSGTQHNLLSGHNIGHQLGSSEPEFCPQSTGYESIDIQNRKRFAAQLLPDFVT